MAQPTILILDSGLGGLTVLREVVRLRPDADYIYIADDAFFPYSALDDDALSERVLSVISSSIAEHRPDLVVIACNTASTVVLPALRQRFEVPFVGTVPAIKPACARSKSRLVSVLGTAATVRREYTQGLIRDFGEGCDVALVGSDRLAALAEAHLRGEPTSDDVVLGEIAPCFLEKDGRCTDVVVLACTHYPLLLEQLQRAAPWPVDWLDPSEAIARRVVDIQGAPESEAATGNARILFTSGEEVSGALAASLRSFGIGG